MPDRYLGINPDGSLFWILTDNDHRLDHFRKFIRCNWLENVYTKLPEIAIIVDEVGKVKQDPQPFNCLASMLYRGSEFGDFIYGPVIIAGIHETPDGDDWFPPTVQELLCVQRALGVDLGAAKEWKNG